MSYNINRTITTSNRSGLKWPDGNIEILAEEGIDAKQIPHNLRCAW